jgi:hypothetical protein
MSSFVESLNFALRNDVVPVEVAHLTFPHILGLYYFPTWMSWTYAPMIVTTLDYYFQWFLGFYFTRYVTMPWFQRAGHFAFPHVPALEGYVMVSAVVINIVLYNTMRQALVPIFFNFMFK